MSLSYNYVQMKDFPFISDNKRIVFISIKTPTKEISRYFFPDFYENSDLRVKGDVDFFDRHYSQFIIQNIDPSFETILEINRNSLLNGYIQSDNYYSDIFNKSDSDKANNHINLLDHLLRKYNITISQKNLDRLLVPLDDINDPDFIKIRDDIIEKQLISNKNPEYDNIYLKDVIKSIGFSDFDLSFDLSKISLNVSVLEENFYLFSMKSNFKSDDKTKINSHFILTQSPNILEAWNAFQQEFNSLDIKPKKKSILFLTPNDFPELTINKNIFLDYENIILAKVQKLKENMQLGEYNQFNQILKLRSENDFTLTSGVSQLLRNFPINDINPDLKMAKIYTYVEYNDKNNDFSAYSYIDLNTSKPQKIKISDKNIINLGHSMMKQIVGLYICQYNVDHKIAFSSDIPMDDLRLISFLDYLESGKLNEYSLHITKRKNKYNHYTLNSFPLKQLLNIVSIEDIKSYEKTVVNTNNKQDKSTTNYLFSISDLLDIELQATKNSDFLLSAFIDYDHERQHYSISYDCKFKNSNLISLKDHDLNYSNTYFSSSLKGVMNSFFSDVLAQNLKEHSICLDLNVSAELKKDFTIYTQVNDNQVQYNEIITESMKHIQEKKLENLKIISRPLNHFEQDFDMTIYNHRLKNYDLKRQRFFKPLNLKAFYKNEEQDEFWSIYYSKMNRLNLNLSKVEIGHHKVITEFKSEKHRDIELQLRSFNKGKSYHNRAFISFNRHENGDLLGALVLDLLSKHGDSRKLSFSSYFTIPEESLYKDLTYGLQSIMKTINKHNVSEIIIENKNLNIDSKSLVKLIEKTNLKQINKKNSYLISYKSQFGGDIIGIIEKGIIKNQKYNEREIFVSDNVKTDKNTYCVYSDASFNPNKSTTNYGFAFLIRKPSSDEVLYSFKGKDIANYGASSDSSEFEGVVSAIKIVKYLKDVGELSHNKKIEIRCDNLNVVRFFNNQLDKNKLWGNSGLSNLSDFYLAKISILLKQNGIKDLIDFKWMKGHNNDIYNKYTDLWAKEALNDESLDFGICKIDSSLINCEIKKSISSQLKTQKKNKI